jgi:hypothetical protein
MSISYIQVYVDINNKLPKDIIAVAPVDLRLTPVDAVVELNDIRVYSDGRKIPAWKAINTSAVKSYTNGVPIAIPCEHENIDIFVDFTMGHCIRQGTIKIYSGVDVLYSTVAIIPDTFRFPSGYTIKVEQNGDLRMTSCGPSYTRGSSATLILWLGANQTPPVVGTANNSDYRFPVPVSHFNMLTSIKVVDGFNKKNRYPTPINSHTKIVKAAIESAKKGSIVYFKSIKADFEFMVDFSSNTIRDNNNERPRVGFVHISDIKNNKAYEIRAQFPINYMM